MISSQIVGQMNRQIGLKTDQSCVKLSLIATRAFSKRQRPGGVLGVKNGGTGVKTASTTCPWA